MSGYTPGEQPKPGERVIKLNTNENPFPPSPRVMDAIRSFDPEYLRRYPSPMADAFRQTAARLHAIRPEMVLAGNGSDDILAIALRTFCGKGDLLAYPDPTYSLYPVLAEMAEVPTLAVPWAEGWKLPVDDLVKAKPAAIFFANPNAPSGTWTALSEIRRLSERADCAVLVDEAYVDFASEHAISLLADCPNLIISRTLSKSYSLAGLRFGYAMASETIIHEMLKVKDSYNCDAISIAAACAALEDQAYARETWEYVRAERERVSEAFRGHGFDVIPSEANFILVTCPDGNAKQRYLRLKEHGIVIRYFDKPGLSDKLRLSIGKREENDAVLATLFG